MTIATACEFRDPVDRSRVIIIIIEPPLLKKKKIPPFRIFATHKVYKNIFPVREFNSLCFYNNKQVAITTDKREGMYVL